MVSSKDSIETKLEMEYEIDAGDRPYSSRNRVIWIGEWKEVLYQNSTKFRNLYQQCGWSLVKHLR